MTEMVPRHLYDTAGSLELGVQRCRSYLMRVRLECLVNQFDGPIGLRRATHLGPLIEVVYQSYEKGDGSGLFPKPLWALLSERLRNATLQEQEQNFADIFWWKNLNRDKAHVELESNLKRLLEAEPTVCVRIGIELHVLLDDFMRCIHGENYKSVITQERIASSEVLRESIACFAELLRVPKAA